MDNAMPTSEKQSRDTRTVCLDGVAAEEDQGLRESGERDSMKNDGHSPRTDRIFFCGPCANPCWLRQVSGNNTGLLSPIPFAEGFPSFFTGNLLPLLLSVTFTLK